MEAVRNFELQSRDADASRHPMRLSEVDTSKVGMPTRRLTRPFSLLFAISASTNDEHRQPHGYPLH